MSAAMSRQPPRGRRIRTPRAPSPSPRPFPPQLKWLTTRPRSVTRRDVRHGSHLKIDKFAVGAPRTPLKETEDKIGQSVAAGDPKTSVANPSRPRALQIRDVRASPQPSATSYKFFTNKSSSSSSPSEESGISWQTVPVVEAAIPPPGRRLHMTVAPQNVKQETHDSESHFPIPKRNKISTRSHTRTIKQEIQSGIQSGIQPWQPASPSPFKHSRSNMSPPATGRGASRRGRGRGRPGRGFQRRPSPPETATGTGSTSSYTRPPHPYSTGKVSKVNICPICEKYTVTELDRPADSDPSGESLRARFKCELCKNVFDLGIPLFDPRGSPGVTLYEGEDRFVPPVPPRATYPCPKCWMSSDSSFQCMTVYLKEESRVACEPACRPGRTRGANKEKGVKTIERRTTRQSSK